MPLYLWVILYVQVCKCTFFKRVHQYTFECVSVYVCLHPGVTSCESMSVCTLISACVWVLDCGIFLIAGVLEGQLFDLGAVPGLSTRCAGWSPIMLGWSQTQPHYWLPGRPSHQPRCYTPLTTSLARFDPPSLLCYTLLCQQQEASAGTTGTQPEECREVSYANIKYCDKKKKNTHTDKHVLVEGNS